MGNKWLSFINVMFKIFATNGTKSESCEKKEKFNYKN